MSDATYLRPQPQRGQSPQRLNPNLVRSENVIRDDLRQQLEGMHRRWSAWVCGK